MKRACLTLLAFCLGAIAHNPAAAQDFYLPPIVNNVGMGNIAIGAAAQGSIRGADRSTERSVDEQRTLVAPTMPATSVADIDFTYNYERDRTRRNLQAFVA